MKVLGLAGSCAALLVAGQPAVADPLAKTAYVGVGSDTIQDVMNAFAGASPYTPPGGNGVVKLYTPLLSTQATGTKGIVSFDAVDPANPTGPVNGCITTKYGGGAFARPNGSGQGISALSRVGDAQEWTKGTNCTSTGVGNVSGQIDFARSSSGSSTFPAGTLLTFIPFARDAVSYAYFDRGSGDLANLTTSQLQQLYGTGNVSTGGTITVNGHTVHACMVQSGSGTGKFWNQAMGNTTSNSATAIASANASGCGSTYEEHNYNAWSTSTYITSTLPATDYAVIPFSAGQWIAQALGNGVDRSNLGRPPTTATDQIGSINGDTPIQKAGCAGGAAYCPDTTFYAGTTFGRDLYVVVLTSRIGTFGDAGLKSLFVGTGAAICSAAAQTTDRLFGFSYPPAVACGDVSQKSGYNPN